MSRRTDAEVTAFFAGWSWEKIYQSWKFELMRLDSSIKHPFFTELRLFVPEYRCEQVELYWCPPESILPFHAFRQAVYDNSRIDSLYMGNISGYGECPKYTLNHLWQVREDEQKIAAILFCSSLFSLIGSSRSYRGEEWPSYMCLHRLESLAWDAWGGKYRGWPTACTDVLPFSRHPRQPIKTIEELIQWLATDHAFLLAKYFPIALVHGTEREPVVDAFISKKIDEKQKAHDLWQAEQRERNRIREEKLQDARVTHPRYGEWEAVTKEELAHLVWNKPATAIASDFGVSDVAVAKKCKAMSISKPPRGYWAKMQDRK